MSSKSKRKPKDVSMHKAVSIAMTIFVWAWMECFHPTQEDVNRMSDEVRNIRESVNSFIRTLIGRGALIDGKCSYDSAKNEATQIAAGHLVFDIEFMPPTPAERIAQRLRISGRSTPLSRMYWRCSTSLSCIFWTRYAPRLPSCGRRRTVSMTRSNRSMSLRTRISKGVVMVPSSL